MRLILAFLALANARWAVAEAVRADWLRAQSEAAYGRALARLALSDRLLDRARL